MIVLPSVTKAQAERSYRTQVQLFETNKLQSKKPKISNNKQGTRITQRIHNDSPKGLQAHTSTLKYNTRQRFVTNTGMIVCICITWMQLSISISIHLNGRSQKHMACMLPSLFIGTFVEVLENYNADWWQGKNYLMLLRIHNMCTSKMSTFI